MWVMLACHQFRVKDSRMKACRYSDQCPLIYPMIAGCMMAGGYGQ